jgi:hypothetical protein
MVGSGIIQVAIIKLLQEGCKSQQTRLKSMHLPFIHLYIFFEW